jgi:RNA polymerase sigma-70 factor (ECF subfamily)
MLSEARKPGVSMSAGNDEVMRLLLKNQSMLSVFVFTLVQDWDLADDAVQEAAVYICSHWQEFTPGTNFGAWARAIARNRLRELLKARQKTGAQIPELDLDSLSEHVTEKEWDRYGDFFSTRKQALSDCVQTLPHNARRVIDLHYAERQSAEDIAAEMKRSIDAVYKMLSRIRVQLRQCVEQHMAREGE